MHTNYEAAYKVLFNAVTDAITEIERTKIKSKEMIAGIEILKRAQQKAEDIYIESSDF